MSHAMAEQIDSTFSVESSIVDTQSMSMHDSNDTPPATVPGAQHTTPFNTSYEDHVTTTSTDQSLKAALDMIINLFSKEEEENVAEQLDDDDDTEIPVDLEDQLARTVRLRRIVPALDQLWWNKSDYLIAATEELANGSRNVKWRIPLAEAGILDSYLRIVALDGVSDVLLKQTLRLVGNSCADTDANREIAVASNAITAIIKHILNPALTPFAIPVLFNICVGYAPAQRQSSEAFLSRTLVELMQSSAFVDTRSLTGYMCRLLDLMIAQPSELDNAPENLATVLYSIATGSYFPHNDDDFLSLVNTGTAYLKHERFQASLVKDGGVAAALQVLLFSYERFEEISDAMADEDEDDDAADITTQLDQMRIGMNSALSDVSALPIFAATCPVLSPLSSQLQDWLSSPHKQLQICACIMLGNLARSDEACIEFVHTSAVHRPLLAILDTENDVQLLFAVLGFLKNLALSVKNKATIGDAGILDKLQRLWSLDTQPQVQYSSISLVRQLCVSCFENVQKIAKQPSDDFGSTTNKQSQLSLIISVFERTDSAPIQMEIARLVTTVCRVSNTRTENDAAEESRRQTSFAEHPRLVRPLAFMITQRESTVVRSEGWFVMALMARTPEGSRVATDILEHDEVFQTLVTLLIGDDVSAAKAQTELKEAPEDPEDLSSGLVSEVKKITEKEREVQRADRENALVLISELVKLRGDDMTPRRKEVFEDLLKSGSIAHGSHKQMSDTEA